MFQQFGITVYTISTWVIRLVIAVTFHEALHGYVARLCGDDTAWRLGRVSFNPFKHIDPFGTVLLPALPLLMRSPFLFGYAKPVPVNFGALRNPRRDSILVAAAGPVMNFAWQRWLRSRFTSFLWPQCTHVEFSSHRDERRRGSYEASSSAKR